MEKQLTLFGAPIEIAVKRSRDEVFRDYDGFLDKFKPKKTTDDCYTPAPVYAAVLEFVGTLTDLSGRPVVLPFYPGGDFERYDYPEGCIVVDNPPFSIMSRILRFFVREGIEFFLFAPQLTLFSCRELDLTYVIADADITYENGAVVRTGFITNLPLDVRIWCCPALREAIMSAQAAPSKKKKGFIYPDHLVTSAILGKIVNYGVELRIGKDECCPVRESDGCKAAGRSLYGGGISYQTGRQRNGRQRNGRQRNGRQLPLSSYQTGSGRSYGV